jgi:anti-sigma-K factor RskA
MTCTEFEELSGAYVLDAITPEEREEAEAHLAQCSNCTRLVEELRSVVDLLPLSVPQVDPPAELKERIFSTIRGKADLTSQPTQRVPATQQQMRLRRPTWKRWGTQLLAAAAILLFLLLSGMGAWNISLQQRIVASQQRIVSLTPVIYTIRGISPTSNVSGQLIYYPQQDITVLVIHGLPQLEGTHVYQGWFLEGKQPISIGLLNMKNGVASVDFPGSVTGFDAAAISLEPGPTESTPGPKGAVLALGTLNKPSRGA